MKIEYLARMDICEIVGSQMSIYEHGYCREMSSDDAAKYIEHTAKCIALCFSNLFSMSDDDTEDMEEAIKTILIENGHGLQVVRQNVAKYIIDRHYDALRKLFFELKDREAVVDEAMTKNRFPDEE